MILILALALQAAPPSLPDVISKEASAATRTYLQCLHAQALKLEPSGADVDDLFNGAKTACAKEWGDAYEAVVDSNDARPPSPTGKDSQVLAVEFLNSMSESNKQDIRLEVLRRRAARNVR